MDRRAVRGLSSAARDHGDATAGAYRDATTSSDSHAGAADADANAEGKALIVAD